mgnify:CR=1 FL=1
MSKACCGLIRTQVCKDPLSVRTRPDPLLEAASWARTAGKGETKSKGVYVAPLLPLLNIPPRPAPPGPAPPRTPPCPHLRPL